MPKAKSLFFRNLLKLKILFLPNIGIWRGVYPEAMAMAMPKAKSLFFRNLLKLKILFLPNIGI